MAEYHVTGAVTALSLRINILQLCSALKGRSTLKSTVKGKLLSVPHHTYICVGIGILELDISRRDQTRIPI